MIDCIEREVALNRLCKEACNVPNCECDRARCPEWFAIHDAPAADVRPVVHGNCKHGVCQTCFFDWSVVAPLASIPNYCPNCGAKMGDTI